MGTVAVSGVQHRTKFESGEWCDWHAQPFLTEPLASLFNGPALSGSEIKVTIFDPTGQKSQWRRVAP